ncbi:unnamed protein product, partial [Porites lobata]
LCSKTKPSNVSYGIGIAEHDNERRVITAEFKEFYLVASCELDYRQGWDKVFRDYLKNLDKNIPVILCGDLNVAHKEIG